LLGWYEHKAKTRISQSTLATLENSPLVKWISGVYKKVDSSKGPIETAIDIAFTVNPSVLYLKPAAAPSIEDIKRIDPSISVDQKRSSWNIAKNDLLVLTCYKSFSEFRTRIGQNLC
jgi:hypothetical protein